MGVADECGVILDDVTLLFLINNTLGTSSFRWFSIRNYYARICSDDFGEFPTNRIAHFSNIKDIKISRSTVVWAIVIPPVPSESLNLNHSCISFVKKSNVKFLLSPWWPEIAKTYARLFISPKEGWYVMIVQCSLPDYIMYHDSPIAKSFTQTNHLASLGNCLDIFYFRLIVPHNSDRPWTSSALEFTSIMHMNCVLVSSIFQKFLSDISVDFIKNCHTCTGCRHAVGY